MTDIKDLLGKAIGDEPPSGIDRDEILMAGRQRVRRRRRLAACGVIAAVVAAAVGAATLTDFVSVPPDVPPAVANGGPHAPPGPELPLPATPASRPPALTTQKAARLTALLAPHVPANDGKFRVQGRVYLFESDIVGDKSEGVLQVTVHFAGAARHASCEDVPEHDTCEVTSKDGCDVAQATWKSADGERRNLAVVILPDGTEVAAMSSNFSQRYEHAGRQPSGGEPVLDLSRLSKLIVKSKFSVY